MKTLMIDRFWSKVEKTDSCWIWTASRDGYGYGMFRVEPGKVRRAHRVAYEMTHGPIAAGDVLLHSCDNPPCVRPDHLSSGSYADNNADRDRKGRHWTPVGVAHGRAKLTPEAVAEIRATPRSYGAIRALADKHGVAVGTIYGLRTKGSRTWQGAAA